MLRYKMIVAFLVRHGVPLLVAQYLAWLFMSQSFGV